MRDLSTVPFGLDMTARVNSDQAVSLLLAMSPLRRPQPRARITGERCRITWRAGALAAVEVPLGLIDDFRRQLHEPPPLTASAWGACRSCTELHDMDALLWIDGMFTCWRCHVKPLPRPRNPWNEHDQPDVSDHGRRLARASHGWRTLHRAACFSRRRASCSLPQLPRSVQRGGRRMVASQPIQPQAG